MNHFRSKAYNYNFKEVFKGVEVPTVKMQKVTTMFIERLFNVHESQTLIVPLMNSLF